MKNLNFASLKKYTLDPEWKMILVLFFPIFVDYLLNNSITLVHSYLVASVGEAAISGIGLVGTITTILEVVIRSLPGAVSILIAQYMGTGDYLNARRCVSQSYIMVGVFSVFIMCVMLIFPHELFDLFFSTVEENTLREGLTYIKFYAVSLVFEALFQVAACSCRGYMNTKIPLVTSVSGSVVNIIVAAILIKVFHLGVAGAGIARIACGVWRVVFSAALLKKMGWIATLVETRSIQWKALGSIAKLGLLASSESLIVNFGGTLKSRYVVAAGLAHTSANSIHNTLFNFLVIGVSVFASVTLTLVGRFIGMGDKEAARAIVKKILFLAISSYTLICVIACFVLPFIFPIYTQNPETQTLLNRMMIIHILLSFIALPFVNVVNNAFKGAGDAMNCTITSIVCMWVVNVGLGIYLTASFGLGLGVVGAMISTDLSCIVKGIIYFFRFRTDRWIKKKLI